MKTSNVKYFKNVNQILTSGNGNPSNKSFSVINTTITNGLAIDNGKVVDFFDDMGRCVTSKRWSGSYFTGISGQETTELSFKILKNKGKKRLVEAKQRAIDANFAKEASDKVVVLQVFNSVEFQNTIDQIRTPKMSAEFLIDRVSAKLANRCYKHHGISQSGVARTIVTENLV